MKTKEFYENENKSLLVEMRDSKLQESDKKRISEQIDTNKKMIAYLSFNPTQEFIVKSIVKLEEKRDILNNRFEAWKNTLSPAECNKIKDIPSFYRKKVDLPKIENQISTLKILLTD